jgi:hypothetical protein
MQPPDLSPFTSQTYPFVSAVSSVQSMLSFNGNRVMSKLGERYPFTRKISVPAGQIPDPTTLLALIQPYLHWQLAELESGNSILLFKSAGGVSPEELMERTVILLNEVARAWLQYLSQPPAQDKSTGTAQ